MVVIGRSMYNCPDIGRVEVIIMSRPRAIEERDVTKYDARP